MKRDIVLNLIRKHRSELNKFGVKSLALFGSVARGEETPESDVDILVVMPARNQLDQAVKISLTIDPPFPLDIIVRTPHAMRWRLAEGDSFLREITSKGKVLYEKADGGMGAEGRGRLRRGRQTGAGRTSPA